MALGKPRNGIHRQSRDPTRFPREAVEAAEARRELQVGTKTCRAFALGCQLVLNATTLRRGGKKSDKSREDTVVVRVVLALVSCTLCC